MYMFSLLRQFRSRPLHSYTIEEVARAHEEGTEQELMHGVGAGEYVGDFVFGAIDGVVTTFAVVAGIAGAELSAGVVLIAGFASLFADGFAMGVGNYLSIRSEREHYNQERKRELWEIEHVPEHERDEVRAIYASRGFSGNVLDSIVETITTDKEKWADTMMREELGLALEARPPVRAGVVTFFSFVGIGTIPLLSYVAALLAPSLLPYTFWISIVLTAFSLFAIGVLKTIVTRQNPLRSGGEIFFVGGCVAFVAYLVGYFLKDVQV